LLTFTVLFGWWEKLIWDGLGLGGVTFQFIGDHIKGYIPSISDQIFFFFSIILSFCDKKFSKIFFKNILKREKRKN